MTLYVSSKTLSASHLRNDGFTTELFEQLGVVTQQCRYDTAQGLVVLDAGVGLVGVLPGVLVGVVRRDLRRDVLGGETLDAVSGRTS